MHFGYVFFTILLGDADLADAGGAENMSRAQYVAPHGRLGTRVGDAKLVDMVLGSLSDPFHRYHIGVTAENVARQFGISREDQDALVLASHHRAGLLHGADSASHLEWKRRCNGF